MRNRIFITFIVVVFIPFSILQIWNNIQTERMIGQKISEQNAGQLNYMKQVLDRIRNDAQTSVLQLEHDDKVRTAVRSSSGISPEERRKAVQDELNALKSEYMPSSLYIHYTLVDAERHVFSSNPMGIPNRGLTDSEAETKLFDDALSGEMQFAWQMERRPEALREFVQGKWVLCLYSRTADAELRIRASIDLDEWLRNTASTMQVMQDYVLLNDQEVVLSQTKDDLNMDSSIFPVILQNAKQSPKKYVMDATGSKLINSMYLPSIQAVIVSQFPFDIYYGDIKAKNNSVLFSFLLITLFFVGISFVIVSTLTKPLRLLEQHMMEASAKRLSIKLPERKLRGEIHSFVRTFNGMIDDITRLISQLKKEERQKEAIRFQMLLTQMNPHFLLNTLNVIKWNAVNFGDTTTAEMCKALGKLLESSLNTEVELVHLRDELKMLEAYIYIQSFRFDHSFETVYACDPSLSYALVPKLSLQPLVENAIQHGLVHRKIDGAVTVKAYLAEGRLMLEIGDNGAGVSQAKSDAKRRRQGIGLSNLAERLALLYQEEGKLELLSQEEGTVARMTIPLLLSNPYQQNE